MKLLFRNIIFYYYIMTFWEYKTKNLDILKNRENFVTEFGVIKKKLYYTIPKYIYDHFIILHYGDCKEVFTTTNKNYVLITNLFCVALEPLFIKNGWTKYSNLYFGHATTWYKIIPFRSKKLLCNSVTLK